MQCPRCPYRLSSKRNSSVCAFCAKDFYLKAATANSTELNKDPGAFCLKCPDNAKCDRNTTIKTLKGKNNTWRDSDNTETYYECENSYGCLGSSSCDEGYEGVLCEMCTNKVEYFDQDDGKCTVCPHSASLLYFPGIV